MKVGLASLIINYNLGHICNVIAENNQLCLPNWQHLETNLL